MCHGVAGSIETKAVDRWPIASRFGGEPDLAELLHDPIARALTAADHVDSDDVYALLRKAHGSRRALVRDEYGSGAFHGSAAGRARSTSTRFQHGADSPLAATGSERDAHVGIIAVDGPIRLADQLVDAIVAEGAENALCA